MGYARDPQRDSKRRARSKPKLLSEIEVGAWELLWQKNVQGKVYVVGRGGFVCNWSLIEAGYISTKVRLY